MAIGRSDKIIQISSGTIMKALLIVSIFVAFYYLRDIVLVVLLAVIIASAVEPGTQWFLRLGIPRIISVLFIYSVAVMSLVLMFYFQWAGTLLVCLRKTMPLKPEFIR